MMTKSREALENILQNEMDTIGALSTKSMHLGKRKILDVLVHENRMENYRPAWKTWRLNTSIKNGETMTSDNRIEVNNHLTLTHPQAQ